MGEKYRHKHKKIISLTYISDRLEQIVMFIGVIAFAGLTLNLIVAILFRYFLNAPLYWSDELSLFLFAWITFLGGSLGVKRLNLTTVTIVTDRVKGLPLFYLKLVQHITILAFALVLTYYSLKWLSSESLLSQSATTMAIPIWIPYAILPFSMLTIIVFSIDHLVKLVKERRSCS